MACEYCTHRLFDQLDRIELRLTSIQATQEKIMSDIDTANALLAKIDAATTTQGQALAVEATNLTTISNNLDALIAQAGTVGSLPPALLTALQAEADNVDKISTSVQANSTFSTALASKGVAQPVPVAPPAPTPVVPPVTPVP
jgi:hypothetical protein